MRKMAIKVSDIFSRCTCTPIRMGSMIMQLCDYVVHNFDTYPGKGCHKQVAGILAKCY